MGEQQASRVDEAVEEARGYHPVGELLADDPAGLFSSSRRIVCRTLERQAGDATGVTSYLATVTRHSPTRLSPVVPDHHARRPPHPQPLVEGLVARVAQQVDHVQVV